MEKQMHGWMDMIEEGWVRSDCPKARMVILFWRLTQFCSPRHFRVTWCLVHLWNEDENTWGFPLPRFLVKQAADMQIWRGTPLSKWRAPLPTDYSQERFWSASQFFTRFLTLIASVYVPYQASGQVWTGVWKIWSVHGWCMFEFWKDRNHYGFLYLDVEVMFGRW